MLLQELLDEKFHDTPLHCEYCGLAHPRWLFKTGKSYRSAYVLEHRIRLTPEVSHILQREVKLRGKNVWVNHVLLAEICDLSEDVARLYKYCSQRRLRSIDKGMARNFDIDQINIVFQQLIEKNGVPAA